MAVKLQIFFNKKIPRVEFNHTCLAVISLDSAVSNFLLESFKKFYQVFLGQESSIPET